MPGKSWKCRSCQHYNKKTDKQCGWCGDYMQLLVHAGSSGDAPTHSYDSVPPGGYGKGKGSQAFSTVWPPQAGDYGYGDPGYGNDPNDIYIWTPEVGRSNGPPPRSKYPPPRPSHYASTYGAGAKGKGKGAGKHYVPGSEYVYPQKGQSGAYVNMGYGKGHSKGKGKQQEEEYVDSDTVYTDTSGGIASPSPSQRRRWAGKGERREASRSRSDARPLTDPPGHWAFVPEQPPPSLPPREWIGGGGKGSSPSPEGTAPVRVRTSPARSSSVKIEEVDMMDVEGERSTTGTEPPIQAEAPSTPDHLARIGYGVVLVNDAKVLQVQMEAVQMLIIALKGRTDEYSMASRAGLETDLHALRVRKTRLKPLEDQNAILEALVEKRTTHFSQTEHNVQNAIAEMEMAKKLLLDAQQQLLQVRSLKEIADAAKAQEQQQAEVPDNIQSVKKVADLVCLLPNGMADGFGQCLRMLEQLLQQASASTVTYAERLDSESVCSGATGMPPPTDPYMEHLHIPLFPGGEQSAAAAPTNAEERSHTPSRRARSVEPERSPATRSRSHSASRPFRGKCESMEEAFSRREGRPTGPP